MNATSLATKRNRSGDVGELNSASNVDDALFQIVVAEYLGKPIIDSETLKPFDGVPHVLFNGVTIGEWYNKYGSDKTTISTAQSVQGTLQDCARARSAGD